MQIGKTYSHQNGLEYILVHKPQLLQEVYDVIGLVDASACLTKESKEKTMLGKMLYSPTDMNAHFKAFLNARGWKEDRSEYFCTSNENLAREILYLKPEEQKRRILEAGETPIYSYSQTDFLKDGMAVEIQFGKYSFVAFDLFIKHMGFFIAGKISVGIEILPMKSLQAEMSSGPCYFERELQHIIRQGRGNPPVPLVLIGIMP